MQMWRKDDNFFCFIEFYSTAKNYVYNICSSALWVLLSLFLPTLLFGQPKIKRPKQRFAISPQWQISESITSWNMTVWSWGNLGFPYIEVVIINFLMILPPLLLRDTKLVLCEIPEDYSSSLLNGARQTEQAAAPLWRVATQPRRCCNWSTRCNICSFLGNI